MLDVISDFVILFAVIGVGLAIAGWRYDWFNPAAPRDVVAKATLPDPLDPAPGPSDGDTKDDRNSRSWWSLQRPASDEGDDVATDDVDTVSPEPDVHPAIAEAARSAALKDVEAYPAYWPADAIKKRPGWMVYALEDFLGAPATNYDYRIPGTQTVGSIDLYSVEAVRLIEREDRLISASRRNVIQSRWDARRDARRRRAAAE